MEISNKDIILIARSKVGSAPYFRNNLEKYLLSNDLLDITHIITKETGGEVAIAVIVPNMRLVHHITRIIKQTHNKQRPKDTDEEQWKKILEIKTFQGFNDVKLVLGLLA